MSDSRYIDGRTLPFIAIDNVVLDEYNLTPNAFMLYALIVRYTNKRRGVAWPSTATLAKRMQVTRPTVHKALGELIEKGLITKESGKLAGVVNVYEIVDLNPDHVVDSVSPEGVKQVYTPWQGGLHPPVNDVDTIKIDSKKIEDKDSSGAKTPQETSSGQPGPKRTAKKPKAYHDAIYDLLAERSFGLNLSEAIPSNLGSRIGKLKTQVVKDFPDLRPEELQAAYDHFARVNPKVSTPRGAGTITAMITDYRHSQVRSGGVVYTPADLDRLREEQARQTEEEADRLMAEMQERLRYGLAATRNRSHENDQEA